MMANYDTFYFCGNIEINNSEEIYIAEDIENNQYIALTEEQSGFNHFTGYYLDSWNTSRDGTGTKYLPGELIDNPSSNHFYAIWKKPPKYLITAEQLENVADTIRICAGTSTKLSYPWGFIEGINTITNNFENFLNGTITNLYLKANSIRDFAFYYHSNLTSVNFPNCTSIGNSAFYRCSNLISINFPACTTIGNFVFYMCSNLTSINFPVCITIGSCAFSQCSSLTSIDFPSCTTIGFSAFYQCSSLTSINFPACTTIRENAFYQCPNLISINFPTCTTIGSAFGYCINLTSISFPSCTKISGTAFKNCYRLLSAYFLNSSIPSLQYSSVFSSTPIAGFTSYTNGIYGSIFVRASMLEAFKSKTNWAYYSSRFVGLTDEEIASLEN